MHVNKDDMELVYSWIIDKNKDPQSYLLEYEWLEIIIPKMFSEIVWLRRRQDELLQMLHAATNHTGKLSKSKEDDGEDSIWMN